MESGLVRPLRADEIECRISTINEKGLSLLLYKDARVDQRILDETFGPFGWMRTHQCINGAVYCTVEIYDRESGVWVAKQDVGCAGTAEKEKSQASDSFKRACFNWGIGRELYTAPFIWVTAGKADIRKKDNRFYCGDRFYLESIVYDNGRKIVELFIVNEKGQAVYEYKAAEARPTIEKKAFVSGEQLQSLAAELERTGIAMEAVKERYQIKEPENMSAELYAKVMKALSKTKSAKAA